MVKVKMVAANGVDGRDMVRQRASAGGASTLFRLLMTSAAGFLRPD